MFIHRQRAVPRVDRRAAQWQRERLGEAAVVGQRAEHGIGVLSHHAAEAAACPVVEVIAAVDEAGAVFLAVVRAVVVGDDAVLDAERPSFVPDAAAGGIPRRVVSNATAHNSHHRSRSVAIERAAAVAATAGGHAVAGNGAVDQVQRAAIVDQRAAVTGGSIARQLAVADGQHAGGVGDPGGVGRRIAHQAHIIERQRPAVENAAAAAAGERSVEISRSLSVRSPPVLT